MVKKINGQEFAAEAMKAPVAVVDFNATWCGPCRMLAPVLEDISEKYAGKVSFFSVDVDEAPGLAMQYRVNSVPCLVLLKDGEFADQSVGFRPEPQLTAWIDSNLK
jgi:thioredoxin 1